MLAHPLGYLAYLWEVFLPRLSFMAPHFETAGPPGFLIYVERGWGAFGWYVVFFPPWVFDVIFGAMIARRSCWRSSLPGASGALCAATCPRPRCCC